MSRPLWTPSPGRVADANLTSFQKAASKAFDLSLMTYADLHAWSVAEPATFWQFYADYAGITFKTRPEKIMSDAPMPHTKWFEGATLNYAEHLLFPARLEHDKQTALIAVTETGHEQSLTYADLREQTTRCAAALRKSGVASGDRVVAYATNTAEAVVLLLACASIGAIFSSCSPDFGFDAAHARFHQVNPKVLVAASAYSYGGKRFDTTDTVRALSERIASLEQTVSLSYPGETGETPFISWEDWLEPQAELDFKPLPFDHPLYVLFSSGTTGLPKAIVHRAGGALLKHHSEHHLHSDIKPGDRVFYFTTCGWMMWNWLVSALAQAATIILYEGSPGHPDLTTLWHLTDKHGFTFFGTSARFIDTLQTKNLSPKSVADLSTLRTLASTGSPLSPAGFRYVYSDIKEDIHLASISGGTDIVGCFMLGVPTLPVYSEQIQGPALGVDLVALSPDGEPLQGEPGELVCRKPLPSMPLEFWDDPDFERYKEAYFEMFPGLWRHGDLIEMTGEGGVIVYGRSDATLNPGGVRIGTAEIYRPLEHIPAITEAMAVGKKQDGDELIWLFVVLTEGETLTDALVSQIKTRIRQEASPRHVPKQIFQVPQLPHTRSGKAMEIAVAHLINGRDVRNRQVMENPDALEAIKVVLDQQA